MERKPQKKPATAMLKWETTRKAICTQQAAQGISDYQIAKIAEVPRTTVSRALTGKTIPKITTVIAILEIVGLDYSLFEVRERSKPEW